MLTIEMVTQLSPEHQRMIEALIRDLNRLERLEAMNLNALIQINGRHRLTTRQREILSYVVKGYSDKQIAYRLGIREHTVKHHMADIREKLGALNRSHAVAIALASDLGVYVASEANQRLSESSVTR